MSKRNILEISSAKLYSEKEFAFKWLEKHVDIYTNMSDVIWSYAELALQEFNTANLVAKHLEKAGFTINRGLAGMPTCFSATYGSGSPVIVFMGEIDALPKLSQKANTPYQVPIIPSAPGHGCGHNQQAPVAAAAAIAIKQVIDKYDLKGTIKFFSAPAEEIGIGRPYMVKAGMFNGTTAVFGSHGSSSFGGGVLGGSFGSAKISTEFTFHGITAHAATSPESGRSALDAVEIMNVATNYLREHLNIGQRMHYVITKGGDAPNLVPEIASVWYYIRNSDEELFPMYKRVQNCAIAAALATGTKMSERVFSAIHSLVVHRGMTKLVHQNCMLVGLPEWSDNEEEFAKAVQRELGVPEKGYQKELGTLKEYIPTTSPFIGGGSSDVAEVTRIVPYATVWIPNVIPGAIGHHWSTTVSGIGSANDKAILAAAKVMAGSGLDLYKNLTLVQEFADEQTKIIESFGKYESYLPKNTEPPLDLNKNLMEKYRPTMEKHFIEFKKEIF